MKALVLCLVLSLPVWPQGARMKIVTTEPTLTGSNVFARIETDAGTVGCGVGDQRTWRKGTEGLLAFRGPQVEFRLCQSTLVRDQVAGNADCCRGEDPLTNSCMAFSWWSMSFELKQRTPYYNGERLSTFGEFHLRFDAR